DAALYTLSLHDALPISSNPKKVTTMIRKYISYIVLTLFFSSVGISCSDSFLDQPPPGTYSDVSLQNLKGVEGMLIATYAALDGRSEEHTSELQSRENLV